MKRLLCVLFTLSLMVLTGCAPEESTSRLFAMDTVMNLSAYGSGSKAALSQASEAISRLDKLLSVTDSDSELSAVNAGAGTAVSVSEPVYRLVESAISHSAATGGCFDVTVAPVVKAWGFTTDSYQIPAPNALEKLLPLVDSSLITLSAAEDSALFSVALAQGQSMDLGGIAKGYTSDCVENLLRLNGVEGGTISLGGNIYAHGSKPDGSGWRVGVQDPANDASFAAILLLKDAYAVTSGSYQRYFEEDGQRYHHIIDPATGSPAKSGLVSVTVVAPANGTVYEEDLCPPGNGTMCDALSTALFVMGEAQALDFWRNSAFSFEMILITEDSRVLVTQGLSEQFEEMEGTGYRYEIVR